MQHYCPHSNTPLQTYTSSRFGFSSVTGALHSLDAESLSYDDSYFIEDYKKQYGKTYIEDEPNLRSLAKKRLARITRHLQKMQLQMNGNQKRKLLEVGSATGFFLDEARSAGFEVQGIETSSYASEYAVKQLALDVQHVSFLECDLKEEFDVIAAYYVIEHFQDQKKVFEKLRELTHRGSLISFALPSFNGPLYRCHQKAWQREHPKDHFVDYDPSSLNRTAKLYNIKALECRPASYHPERACGVAKIFSHLGLYKMYADLKCYGDTIDWMGIVS